MLDLRVILGLHFHNLGPGRSCTEAKYLVQTKIEQTAPETNSISRFTPLVPGMTNCLSESLKKPSLCACQAAGFPDRKERHFHTKAFHEFRYVPLTVLQEPCLQLLRCLSDLIPLPHQQALKLSRLGTCQTAMANGEAVKLKVKASRNKKRCNWCNWHASTFPHLHKKKAGFTWPARSASLAFSLRSSTLSTSCFFWASTCSEVHHQNFRAVSAVSTHSVPRLLQLPRTGSFQQRSTCLLPQRLHLFSLALTCSSCSFLCQDFTQLARWGAWPQIFKATW